MEYYLNIVHDEYVHIDDVAQMTEEEAVSEWDALNRGYGVIHTLHVAGDKVEILTEDDMLDIWKGCNESND